MNLKAPGTYMLLLDLLERSDVEVGRGLQMVFDSGLYCYVGSALGPGGLAARLRRHASSPVRKHWHIDYFTPYASVAGSLVIEGKYRYECDWAAWVGGVAQSCIEGFGASDCQCRGHLFHMGAMMDAERFVEKTQGELGAYHVPRRALRCLVP